MNRLATAASATVQRALSRLAAAAAAALLLLATPAAASERAGDLWQAYARKAGTYPLETRHLDAAQRPRFVNALILEASPYLLQHAHNPVAWNAWSDKVLAAARAKNRPIFVSVGYSTCHWCRVMARESFDSTRVADLLNADYTSIKIDREERPDLDEFFLSRLEALSASPGWPMTLVLTPEGELFSAESYMTEPALIAHLQRLARAWKERPDQVRRLAATITSRLSTTVVSGPRDADASDSAGSGGGTRAGARAGSSAGSSADPAVSPGESYDQALTQVRQAYDEPYGGFGRAAKFPDGPRLAFLLGAHARRGDAGDRAKFLESLRAIALGALQDPVDGGFFRYSLTRDWQTPHFEKMLTDQASLARLFAEAWKLTADPLFARAAAATVDFVDARLRGADGLYFAAMDAESAGSAGAFYLWREHDLAATLSAAQRTLVEANFRPVAQPEGALLLLPRPDADAADLAAARALLAAIRKQRPLPAIDAKVITGWNAMMIESLARTGVLLAQPRHVADAVRAMRSLLALHARGAVVARYSIEGKVHGAAATEDFAALFGALAALHDADRSREWHDHARRLLPKLAASESSKPAQLRLFSRDRDMPAATAVLIEALEALSLQTGDARFRKALDGIRPVAAGVLAGGGGAERASLAAALLGANASSMSGGRARVVLAEGHVRAELVPGGAAESRAGAPAARGPRDASDANDSSNASAGTGDGTRLRLTLKLDPGWHINSNAPLQDYLIPVAVTGGGGHAVSVTYPPAKIVRLGAGRERLSVYEGEVSIGVEVIRKGPDAALEGLAADIPVRLTLQACTAKACLPPETVEMKAAAPGGARAGLRAADGVQR